MTKGEFLRLVYTTYQKNNTWRFGQTLFNALQEVHPQAADEIRGTIADPFHALKANSKSIGLFFNATDHLWD